MGMGTWLSGGPTYLEGGGVLGFVGSSVSPYDLGRVRISKGLIFAAGMRISFSLLPSYISK